MENLIPIYCGAVIILAVIGGIIDSSQRKKKAEKIGLIKCPNCHGTGWINDDDDNVRCRICRNSPVRGYITQERKDRYKHDQTIGCIIFLIIVLVIAYFILSG